MSPAFGKKKGGWIALLAPAVSQMPLSQNNQHAREAYFGVRCSELLQYQSCWYKFMFSEHGLYNRTDFRLNSSEALAVADLVKGCPGHSPVSVRKELPPPPLWSNSRNVGVRSAWKGFLLLLPNCAQISCTIISEQLQRQELAIFQSSSELCFILGSSGLSLLFVGLLRLK